ncbi:acyl-CoA N-acyltransferase [Mycena amicta]|nr:acyl-CoA N-acyltransferase [Mycena amicta]
MATGTNVSIRVRPGRPADIPQITTIINHYIATSMTTFRLEPLAEAGVLETCHAVQTQNLPFLVAIADAEDTILGHTYASGYRMPSHAGYKHTVEISVFVAPGSRTRGVGTRLMDALLESLRHSPAEVKQILAVMAVDPDGPDAGLGLRDWYGRWGFRQVGQLKRVGFKFGKWIDTLFLQLSLEEEEENAAVV